jgi:hypothetical protein
MARLFYEFSEDVVDPLLHPHDLFDADKGICMDFQSVDRFPGERNEEVSLLRLDAPFSAHDK